MRLKEWIEKTYDGKHSINKFAAQMGVTPQAVYKWFEHPPRAETILEIEKLTGGQVKFHDFFEEDER